MRHSEPIAAVSRRFKELAQQGRTALIPYLMGGYPDRSTFRDLLLAVADAGADLVEVGIPFSDPVADGPTIQLAGQFALEAGVTPPAVLEDLDRLKERLNIPVLLMTYYNPVLHAGLEHFTGVAGRSGVSGLIVPDLPAEHSAELRRAAVPAGLELVQLVAPTTTPQRAATIARRSSGFLYLVAVTGVTGHTLDENHDAADLVAQLRTVTDLPICLGFGIATPAQAARAARCADGVITGSALIRTITTNRERAADAVSKLLSRMRRAIDQGEQSP